MSSESIRREESNHHSEESIDMQNHCPKCGHKENMSAIHGKIRSLACLNCGQGWKKGISGSTNYGDEVLVEFGSVMERMIVRIGRRRVRLAAVTVR